jgi:hypothetical protein
MAYFAKLNDAGVVETVIAVANEALNNLPFPESEPVGIAFLTDWSGGYTNWKQTSYNANFRKNYAGESYIYDTTLDAFIAPSPYPSWLLNIDTCKWEPPIPRPNDEKRRYWDEETQQWVEAAAS